MRYGAGRVAKEPRGAVLSNACRRGLIDSGEAEVALESWPGNRCTVSGLRLYGLPNFRTECRVSTGSPVLVERPINGP